MGEMFSAQIFNRSDMMEKVKDGSLGFPWGREGQIYTTSCLVMIPLILWMVKPHSRRQLTREKRIANYRISRGRRVVENAFGILLSHVRVLFGTKEQRLRVVRHCVYICGVAQHAEDTQGWGRQGTNPSK